MPNILKYLQYLIFKIILQLSVFYFGLLYLTIFIAHIFPFKSPLYFWFAPMPRRCA